MHKAIVNYLQAERELQAAREKVANAKVLASETARPVGALRVATAADIMVGALLWYNRDEDGDDENPWFWCIVEDVLQGKLRTD